MLRMPKSSLASTAKVTSVVGVTSICGGGLTKRIDGLRSGSTKIRNAPAWLVGALVHMLLMVVLALIVFANLPSERVDLVAETGFFGYAPRPGNPFLFNFANIPLRCTIRIFTIDGDLVRELVLSPTD